jgi:protein disulfide-isomerase-like protein
MTLDVYCVAMNCVISLLLLVSLFGAALAADQPHYLEGEDVEIITTENFEALVDNSTDVWLLEYYAPWCGHCKQLAPTYKKVAASLKGKVRVGAVECDANPELAKRAGITGFPSLKIYPSERTFNPYTGVTAKQPYDVNSRDLKAIVSAALKAIPMLIANVTDSTLDAFMSPASLPKVIVLSEKSEPSALIRKLAFEFKNRIRFGQVAPSSNPKAAAALPVSKLPAVLLQSSNGERFQYTGEQSLAAFRDFFELYALPIGARADKWWSGPSIVSAVDVPGLLSRLQPQKTSSQDGDDEALYYMTASQKEAAKAASMPIFAVWFHGPDDDSDVELWAQGWVNSVAFLSVDTSKHSVLDLELPSIPCLRFYKGLDDSDDLEGVHSSAEVASFILSHLPSLVSVFQASELSSMHKSALSAPIAVLYSAKPDIPDLWKRLALQYRGKLSLGIVNQPPPQLLQQYNFKKLPQIMAMFSSNGTAEGLQGAPYQGQFQFDQISQFLKNFVLSDAPKRKSAPAPSALTEINIETPLAHACGDMGLCAIAVLDGLLGETTIKQHVAVFDAVRAKVGGGSAYRFAYVDGVCNRCDERFASLCLAAFRNMVTFSQ